MGSMSYAPEPSAVISFILGIQPRAGPGGVSSGCEWVTRTVTVDVCGPPTKRDDGDTLKVAIPLKALDLVPKPAVKLKGDFGVIWSGPTGQRNAARCYSFNKAAGIVSDLLSSETRICPNIWGEIEIVDESRFLNSRQFDRGGLWHYRARPQLLRGGRRAQFRRQRMERVRHVSLSHRSTRALANLRGESADRRGLGVRRYE